MHARSANSATRRFAAAALAVLACGLPVHGGEPAPGTTPSNRPASFGLLSILPTEWLDDPIEADTGPVEVKNGIIELRGRIDSGMRQRFGQALATGNVTTVRITSQGGYILDAMDIASAMRARGIDVIVHDLCVGACAEFIFVAASKRRLEERSLVGFMYTFKSMGTILSLATDALEVENTREFEFSQYASIEEAFYRHIGVATSLLLDPHVAMQPLCVIMRRDGKRISWNTTSIYNMWVPSREYLKAAGVEFEGDWPKSHFNLGGLADRHLRIRAAGAVRYGDNDHRRSKKEKPYLLEDVKKCVLDELPDDAGTPPG